MNNLLLAAGWRSRAINRFIRMSKEVLLLLKEKEVTIELL